MGLIEVFLGEGIGDVARSKSGAFIFDLNDHASWKEFAGQMNPFPAFATVAMLNGIDERFLDSQLDPEQVVGCPAVPGESLQNAFDRPLKMGSRAGK